MKLQQILEAHVMDPKNPYLCYDLAKAYDAEEQGAMAVSLYLKTADLSDDKELQYKCMIGISRCYDRQRDRGFTVKGALLDAVALLPERAEAHYLLCKYFEGCKEQEKWKECLMHARLGLLAKDQQENCELGFPGEVYLEYYEALATWYIGGQQNAKQMFFDLKHKRVLKPSLEERVDQALAKVFHPDIVTYKGEDFERFKFLFPGLERIYINHSKHFEDMVVLSAFNGKKNGTYLEIGSGGPFVHNNTALLETEYDWKGISVDNDPGLCYHFSEKRRNTVICADATEIDYYDLFDKHCITSDIDYLQIDCDDVSISVLEKMPFDRFKFGVITFEHDAYRLGAEKKAVAKAILEKHGYKLAVPNLSFAPGYAYEDWYYHPDVVELPKEMISHKEMNYVWDYFMEELGLL